MKKYQKQLLLLVGVVSLLLPNLVRGGNNQGSVGLLNQRRHQFGVSISTTLYDGLQSYNPYLYPVGQVGTPAHTYILHPVNSSYGSISLNYRFRFNDAWSIETKLKYRQRTVQFQLIFPARDMDARLTMYSFSTSGYYKYGDLSLPITLDYRWISSMNTGIELFGGIGLSTAGLICPSKDLRLGGTGDFHYELLALEMEYSRNFFVHGIVGAQFDIPFGKLSLKPFITYSFYPNNICRYRLTPEFPGP